MNQSKLNFLINKNKAISLLQIRFISLMAPYLFKQLHVIFNFIILLDPYYKKFIKNNCHFFYLFISLFFFQIFTVFLFFYFLIYYKYIIISFYSIILLVLKIYINRLTDKTIKHDKCSPIKKK